MFTPFRIIGDGAADAALLLSRSGAGLASSGSLRSAQASFPTLPRLRATLMLRLPRRRSPILPTSVLMPCFTGTRTKVFRPYHTASSRRRTAISGWRTTAGSIRFDGSAFTVFDRRNAGASEPPHLTHWFHTDGGVLRVQADD